MSVSDFRWPSQGWCIFIVLVDLFFFSHSKLHRPDIYWPYQPASLQCYQLQCCCSGGGSGSQQLQQLSDVCQQPGPGLQHCHQADLRPHESDSQVQPSGLLSVPCCCKAHLPGCSQPAGKIHCLQNTKLTLRLFREKNTQYNGTRTFIYHNCHLIPASWLVSYILYYDIICSAAILFDTVCSYFQHPNSSLFPLPHISRGHRLEC